MESKTETMKNCKTCKHWKNKQMLLNYRYETGFCINPKFNFNTSLGRLVGVVDTQYLKDRIAVSGNPSNDFESNDTTATTPSRYLLQTEERFGCNFHS